MIASDEMQGGPMQRNTAKALPMSIWLKLQQPFHAESSMW